MQKDRQNRVTGLVVHLVGFRACLTQNNGVHRLKVGRVRGQREVHFVAVERTVGRCAEVVFHVARAINVFGFERTTLEFVKDRAVRFGHHVCQNRQTTTVRHTDDDFLHTQRAPALDDLFHRWDEAFAAVQTKAFGAHVFHMKELLKAFGFDQFVQDRLTAILGKGDLFAETFDPLFQPARLFGIGDVHVLQGKGAAVGAAYDCHDFVHGRNFETQNVVDKDRTIHVRRREAVGFRIKFRMRNGVAHAQRIKVSDQVTTDTIGADDHQRTDRVQNCEANLIFGDRRAFFGGFRFDLVPSRFGVCRPLAIQRSGQVVVRNRRPVMAGPRCTSGFGFCLRRSVAKRCEEIAPAFVDCIWVVSITSVELLNILRIVALQEGRCVEHVVRGLIVHSLNLSSRGREWSGASTQRSTRQGAGLDLSREPVE